nr:toll-like receptor 3 [Lytechinus pictus]
MRVNMILMSSSSFKNMHSLQHLEITRSGLWMPAMWNPNKNESLFDCLFNLRTLDLSKNDLSSGEEKNLPPEVLRQLHLLQNLTLEDCDLLDLHPRAFEELKSLQVLILRNNKIEHIPSDLFKHLVHVARIDLSENHLTYLAGDVFLNNKMLRILTLSDNKLTRLDRGTLQPIYSSLLSIDISLNPIECNCDLSWFLDWLSKSLSLINWQKTHCRGTSLKPLRGQYLTDFDPKGYCHVNIVQVCLPSLAIICLIFIIALVYPNRWLLKHKVFLLKLAAIGYNEVRDARDHKDYEYDLNVIFYDDDENWIRENFRPAVAERLPQFQRNVFGDADLVPGMYYLDAVDYVVSHSYKTVIVLSRVAIRDRWFILKFRTAMDHVSDTGTEFVVVIFLEDIPENEMPFLMRLYLSDGRPYIYWTENVRGREYFFDELTKQLTVNLRTNDRIPNE